MARCFGTRAALRYFVLVFSSTPRLPERWVQLGILDSRKYNVVFAFISKSLCGTGVPFVQEDCELFFLIFIGI